MEWNIQICFPRMTIQVSAKITLEFIIKNTSQPELQGNTQ